MKYQIQDHFPGLSLSKGLFYQWPTSLRFELNDWTGDMMFFPEDQIPKDGSGEVDLNRMGALLEQYAPEIKKKRETYLSQACDKASQLMKDLFQPADEVVIVAQNPERDVTDDPKKISSCIDGPSSKLLETEQVLSPDAQVEGNGDQWNRWWWKTSFTSIDIPQLMSRLMKSEYPENNFEIRSEVYLIHPQSNVLVNLYDDRGMDILAASDKTLLKKLYQSHQKWLVSSSSDREKMAKAIK